MEISDKVQLEKKCSYDSVFGCPALAQGLCVVARQLGQTKEIAVEVKVESTEGLQQMDKEDLIQAKAKQQVNDHPEKWGDCKNRKQLVEILGTDPRPELYYGSPTVTKVMT